MVKRPGHLRNLASNPRDRQSGSSGSGCGENPHSGTDPYRAVFDSAPDGILLVTRDGRILEANRRAHRIFGYEEGELVGLEVEALVPASVREGHRAHREAYAEAPRSRPMGLGMELSGVRRDGVLVPLEISLSPLPPPGGLQVIAVLRDVTARRRLRDFGAEALRAAEEERRRIARELHDETAQGLAALLLRLRVLEDRLEGDPSAPEVARMRTALHETMEGIRRISRGLRPPELDDVGLAAALRSHVRERFGDREVTVAFDGSEARLGVERSLAAYRIAQEALANAARHSGAARIRIEGRRIDGGDEFLLEISDGGRGFDPGEVDRFGGGLGLVGMEERTHLAGGRLEIESGPDDGTRVRLQLPLREDPEPHAGSAP